MQHTLTTQQQPRRSQSKFSLSWTTDLILQHIHTSNISYWCLL